MAYHLSQHWCIHILSLKFNNVEARHQSWPRDNIVLLSLVGHSVWVYGKFLTARKRWKNGARATLYELVKILAIINSSDFVPVFSIYMNTEMEIDQRHIHALTDSYAIWQKNVVRKIPKGHMQGHVRKRPR